MALSRLLDRRGLWLALALTVGCTSLADEIRRVPYAQAGYLGNGPEARLKSRLAIFERHLVKTLGVVVLFSTPDDPRFVGMARADRHILIDASLDLVSKFEVLAHEAAHVLQPETLTRSEAEVFADTVAFLTCRRLGVVSNPDSLTHYLAGHKAALAVLDNYKTEIRWAVVVLTGEP